MRGKHHLLKKLGENDRTAWKKEVQENKIKETIELVEMKDDLIRWREHGKDNF